jgi:hypothetical protein
MIPIQRRYAIAVIVGMFAIPIGVTSAAESDTGTVPAVPAKALTDLQWAAELALSHSDNIRRNDLDKQAADVAQLNLEYAYFKKTRRLDASVAADLAFVDYLDNSFANGVVGTLSAYAAADLIEDRLQWTARDIFGQTHRDLTLAYTPQNRENINFIATGPILFLPVGSSNDIDFDGSYSRVDYQTSPFDSNRYSGGAAFVHNLSANSSVSLNAQSQRVEYVAPASSSSNFDRSSFFLGYKGGGRNTSVLLEVGANRIGRSNADASGALLQLALSRNISARSKLTIGFDQEFTDAGEAFGSASTFTNVSLDTQGLGTTTSPYKLTSGNIDWDAMGRRTRLGVSLSVHNEKYLQQPLSDRTLASGQLRLSRQLTARVSAQLIGSYTDTTFKNIAGSSKDVSGAGSVSWMMTRRLSLDLSLDHFSRKSDVPTFDYVENQVWLKLRLGAAFVRGVGPFGGQVAATSR